MSKYIKQLAVFLLLIAVAVFAVDAAKNTKRGSGISVTIPTEPIAGAAKDKAVMAVLVLDEGVRILEYEIKLGSSIQFRVGGTIKAFMERVGPAPDSDVWIISASNNKEPVTVEFEHALAGPQKVTIGPGQKLTINPVVARRWKMSAKTWD